MDSATSPASQGLGSQSAPGAPFEVAKPRRVSSSALSGRLPRGVAMPGPSSGEVITPLLGGPVRRIVESSCRSSGIAAS
jgi:hypothetical protein